MRVVLFLDSLRPAGAQLQFGLLAEGLARSGHRVTLASLYPGGPCWERLSTQPWYQLHALFDRRGGSVAQRILQLHHAPRRLAALLATVRADVLHSALHTSDLLAWRASRISGRVPIAWSIRTAHQRFPWKQRPAYELCRLVSATVPLMIANSQAGLKDYQARGFRPRASVVIPNGIDSGNFRPDERARSRVRAEWSVPPDSPLIGIVGRLAPVKHHPAFLAAAAITARSHPAARFVCVGDGPSDYRARLAAQAAALGLHDRLTWAGARDDMSAVYNALDLLCLSSDAEGFPNVVAEAMASAVPCAAFEVGDVVEIVGECGTIVPPGDAQSLGEAIAAMLAQPREVRRQIGVRGRQRIVDRYSVDAMLTRTEACLAWLAEGAGAGTTASPALMASLGGELGS
jgi:glycosyltransferase involved in cell wall biosynthesis